VLGTLASLVHVQELAVIVGVIDELFWSAVLLAMGQLMHSSNSDVHF
jgi:hypothetical protein